MNSILIYAKYSNRLSSSIVYRWLMIISFTIFSFLASAQSTVKITGKVLSDAGDALGGTTITEKGTSNITSTAADGSFSITVNNLNSTLIVSFIGFNTKEVPISAQEMTIQLSPSATAMEDVIVIAYGTQKRASSTSAVSSIKGEELAQAPVANISNSLAGRVTGISMRSNGGQPGRDNPDINIRGIATTGNSAPLIVVDGVIRNNINEIDPQAIASVTVLKDAAAVASFGLGGANGVLLITTKRGQTGSPTLTFNAYYGNQTPTYIPKVLDAQDYMRLRNEAYLNENPGSTQFPFANDLIENYKTLNVEDPDRYPISNAVKDVVKYNAPMQQASVQLSGGTKNVKYFGGLGYFNQKGMFDPLGYERFTYNLNLEVTATPTTTVLFSINGAVQTTKGLDTASNTNQLFRSTYKFIPIANLYYSNGLWGEFAGNAPVGVLNGGGYTRQLNNNFLSTVSIEQKLPFVEGLSIKGAFSFDPSSYTRKGWHRPFYYYSQDLSTTPYTYTRQISTQEGGAATFTWLAQDYFQNTNFTYQGFVNYNRKVGKHDISGLLVAEMRNNKQMQFGARRNNFAADIDELNMGSSNKPDFDNSGTSSTGSQVGYVYRVSYGFDNRYFLEASGRYDGHYYFAPGGRWGYFPAFSAGWVLSNEKFFEGIKTIDYLKLRGSWGKSGNLAGTAFQYLSGYTLYGNAYAFGNSTIVQRSNLDREPNPFITWEVSSKSNIGFEATLWNGLLKLEADYFSEKRTGMLLPPAITVPQEYGLSLSDENAGIMHNKGFEITAGTQHQFQNQVRIGVTGNFSYAKNKMIQVFETEVTRNDPKRSRTGRRLNALFGYQSLGLFTIADDKNGDGIINADDGYEVAQFGTLHPGDIKYADLSGPNGVPDGKIDSYDETEIGYPNYPAITYGFSANGGWKGFDLELFFQGAALSSFDVRGFNTIPFNNNNSNSSYEYFDNRWTAETQNARYPRATQSPYSNNNQASDFWIVNTNYLRLKTAVLSYTIPDNISRKLRMSNLRVYFSGQNVFTFSNLKFMDPEVGITTEVSYPTQKVYTFGISASF